MNEPVPERCPVHAQDRPGWEWPCPAYPEACAHFTAEMMRRLADMQNGNYWRMERVDQNMVIHHEYVDHKATGRTRTLTAE